MRTLQDINITSTSEFPWLSPLGKDYEPPQGFKFVKDQKEACGMISSALYENFQTTKQGHLVKYLINNQQQDFQQWNESSIFIKNKLSLQLEKISSIVSDLGLDSIVTASIQWDILHAYQEWIYGDYKIPIYFSTLFPIYEAGHIVCGVQESSEGFTILVH